MDTSQDPNEFIILYEHRLKQASKYHKLEKLIVLAYFGFMAYQPLWVIQCQILFRYIS